MKRLYYIFIIAISITVLSWFLPWLYSLAFPSATKDAFVAYSPINGSFIISENNDNGTDIYDIEADGLTPRNRYTKNERDSLLPQIYFNQLIGREKLPDSINGKEVTVPLLKQSQWIFNSIPRNINRRNPDVFLIMESMPERFDLEDPKEVFRLDGKIEFIDIATNSTDKAKTDRFNEIFYKSGFKYPVKSFNADITSRKPYDEGYLLADADGDIFHMKMQAGRPYLRKVSKPDSVIAEHVFILENIDRRPLGLVVDSENNMYILEKEGYTLIKLPVGKVNPSRERITIMKNMFNWVVKISDEKQSRWIALYSDDYMPLGEYCVKYPEYASDKIKQYIFPYNLTFTSVDDCFVRPHINDISWYAVFMNIILAGILIFEKRKFVIMKTTITLIFGIFAFIPLTLIKH